MIPKIVLTGGPSGGKTTALNYLRTRLPELGVVPFFVPELATFLHSCRIDLPQMYLNPARGFRFNVEMITSQIKHEDMVEEFAFLAPGYNKVLVCDRGTIDNIAYTPDEWHDDILSQVGTLGYLKRRYDAIIHMTTLAFGDGYSLDNPARYETPEQAREVDQRIFQMWQKGPEVEHLVISHTVSLQAKMERTAQAIASVIGR
jgi:hypothetical protein